MDDSRKQSSKEIRIAYSRAEKDLAYIGKLLRTTEAGKYMWSARHKSAVTGLKQIIDLLKYDVPTYDGKGE
jgi:hypothetical protein